MYMYFGLNSSNLYYVVFKIKIILLHIHDVHELVKVAEYAGNWKCKIF